MPKDKDKPNPEPALTVITVESSAVWQSRIDEYAANVAQLKTELGQLRFEKQRLANLHNRGDAQAQKELLSAIRRESDIPVQIRVQEALKASAESSKREAQAQEAKIEQQKEQVQIDEYFKGAGIHLHEFDDFAEKTAKAYWAFRQKLDAGVALLPPIQRDQFKRCQGDGMVTLALAGHGFDKICLLDAGWDHIHREPLAEAVAPFIASYSRLPEPAPVPQPAPPADPNRYMSESELLNVPRSKAN